MFMKKIFKEYRLILRNVPSLVITMTCVSVILMNLLANKTIVQNDYIALDGGIIISWLSFLCMDIITAYFGPKVATKIAILAIVINAFAAFIFYFASIIPTNAGDFSSFDYIFKGTWFIWLASTIAFILASIINNSLNHLIGRLLKEKELSRKAYYLRSYISTFFGQFIDNLTFAIIAFVIFAPIYWDGFNWTIIQCLTCALTGAMIELVFEMVFSPIGYMIIKEWQKDKVGEGYLAYIQGERNESIDNRDIQRNR